MAVIRGFPAQGVVACFTEAGGGGAIDDFNAPRNAPASSPVNYLSTIVFHSSFFQYEIAAGPAGVTINHAALAGKTTYYNLPAGGFWGASPTPVGISIVTNGDIRTTDILLFTHGLGYVPKFMVSLVDRRVPDGYMVQNVGGNYRRVSVWANASHIYLRENAVSGAAGNDLPGVSLTYRVLVFNTPSPNPALPLFGNTIIARGIINTTKKYLRRTGVGDTPFSLNMGRTMDIANGGSRTCSGGITVSEPRYSGSLPAPPFVAVGVD